MTLSNGDQLPLLLTTRETADLLRTTRKAVYAMVERGMLPGVTKLGRRVLVRSDVLLHWLDQKRAPSPDLRGEHPTAPTVAQNEGRRNR